MSLKRAMPAIFALTTLAGCVGNTGDEVVPSNATASREAAVGQPPQSDAAPAEVGAGAASADRPAEAPDPRPVPVARPRPEIPRRPKQEAAPIAAPSAPIVPPEAVAKQSSGPDATTGEDAAGGAKGAASITEEEAVPLPGDSDVVPPAAGREGQMRAAEQNGGEAPDAAEEGSETRVGAQDGDETPNAAGVGSETLVGQDGGEAPNAAEEGSETLVAGQNGDEVPHTAEEGSETLVAGQNGGEAPDAAEEGSETLVAAQNGSETPDAAEVGSETPVAGQNADQMLDAGLPPARQKRRLEDRSLNCDVVQLMGQAIGRWRIRGDERKPATDKAIDDVVQRTGATKDEKFVFSGRVYGMLIYQIESDHTVEGFGAYAQAACLILRGKEGIVPADDASQKRLDQSLSACEAGSVTPEDLTGCIYERMKLLVQEFDRRAG